MKCCSINKPCVCGGYARAVPRGLIGRDGSCGYSILIIGPCVRVQIWRAGVLVEYLSRCTARVSVLGILGCPRFISIMGDAIRSSLESASIHQSSGWPTILLLPRSLVASLWPPERKVLGLRVCRLLRRDYLITEGVVQLHGNLQDFVATRSLDIESIASTFRIFELLRVSICLRGVDDTRLRSFVSGTNVAAAHSRVTSLSLCGLVGDCSMDILRDFLGKTSRLVTLDLGDTYPHRVGRECAWWGDICSAGDESVHGKVSITSGGARALIAVMPSPLHLTHLNLYRQCLGRSGAGFLTFCLPSWVALRSLNLGYNGIHDTGFAAMSSVLPTTLVDLRLGGNYLQKTGILMLSTTIPSLSLTMLCLLRNGDCLYSLDGVSAFADAIGCCKLLHLNIANTGLRTEGLIRLLAHNMGSCSTIQCLHIGGNYLEAVGIQRLGALARVCSLTSLSLGGNLRGSRGTDSWCLWLGGVNTSLRVLDWSEMSVNEQGYIGAHALAAALGCCRALTHLNLQRTGLSTAAADALAAALQPCMYIRVLLLGNNHPGPLAPAKLLRDHSALVTLDVGDGDLGDGSATQLGIALRCDNRLESLLLGSNHITLSGLQFLFQGGGVWLRHLDLAFNNIGAEGGQFLGYALFWLTNITRLDISFNELGDVGVTGLSRYDSLSNLVHLSLDGNLISDVGASSLAQALWQSAALRQLDLARNFIGEVGVGDLRRLNVGCYLGGLVPSLGFVVPSND